MGRAKASAAKSKASPKVKASSAADSSKGDQQLMINSLKQAKIRIENGRQIENDDLRVEVLEKYQSLGRFDQEKKTLLAQWQKDESLQWWKTYEESKGQAVTKEEDGLEGHGSRQINIFHVLDSVYGTTTPLGNVNCMIHLYLRKLV